MYIDGGVITGRWPSACQDTAKSARFGVHRSTAPPSQYKRQITSPEAYTVYEKATEWSRMGPGHMDRTVIGTTGDGRT